MNPIRSGILYAVGDTLLRGLSFLLAFIYANALEPSEFGLLAVATAVSAVVSILLTFGIKAAAFQFLFRFEDDQESRRFYGTLWIFSVVLPGMLLLLLDRALVFVPSALHSGTDTLIIIRLALWSEYLNGNFRLVVQEVLRAKERPVTYGLLSLGNAVTVLFFVVVAVVLGGSGVQGALAAMLLSGMLWAPVYSLVMARHMRLGFDLGRLRMALAYSLPLLPHFLSHWLLSLSDRLILQRLVPLGSVGVYSLGYKIGNVAEVFVSAGNSAIMPRFGRASIGKEAKEQLVLLYSRFVYVIGGIALLAGVLANEVTRWLTPSAYHTSAGITRWVVLGFFCLALYYGPMNSMTLTAAKTRGIARNTFLAGLLNVGLNLVLVPRFGVLAAAMNTFLGYLVLYLLMLRQAQRICPLDYRYGQILRIGCVLGLSLLLDAWMPANQWIPGICVNTLCLGGYLLLGSREGLWSWAEVSTILRSIPGPHAPSGSEGTGLGAG